MLIDKINKLTDINTPHIPMNNVEKEKKEAINGAILRRYTNFTDNTTRMIDKWKTWKDKYSSMSSKPDNIYNNVCKPITDDENFNTILNALLSKATILLLTSTAQPIQQLGHLIEHAQIYKKDL
ncbi:9842_t:CDS:2 [Gigaspora rosea]|nr:9842_t:CDS:2 [Gigaspora rosea]